MCGLRVSSVTNQASHRAGAVALRGGGCGWGLGARRPGNPSSSLGAMLYIHDAWAERMCTPPITITPRVAAFGDGASEEVTEVK